MALGVKGKWKKRKHGCQDYPGQPETVPMHEIHDVMQTLHRLRDRIRRYW
jgi:hypothetical protein